MPGVGWLKQAVLDSGKPKYSIIDKLRNNIPATTGGRSRFPVHASELTNPFFCPRREAFMDQTDTKETTTSYIRLAQRVTFDIGSMTADRFIHSWMHGLAVGNWRCRVCGRFASFCTIPDNQCVGHDSLWQYRECVFSSASYGLSGSIDVFLDLGAPKYMLTELKIMAPEEFDEIICPLAEHTLRTKLYLRIIAEHNPVYASRINLHEARVLYVSRGHGKKNVDHNGEVLPFKEFVVARDDDALVPYLEKAYQLQIFRKDGPDGIEKSMPSGICATALDKAAKKCDFCKECFSGKFPAKQQELGSWTTLP